MKDCYKQINKDGYQPQRSTPLILSRNKTWNSKNKVIKCTVLENLHIKTVPHNSFSIFDHGKRDKTRE